jgi:hypothetical protein
MGAILAGDRKALTAENLRTPSVLTATITTVEKIIERLILLGGEEYLPPPKLNGWLTVLSRSWLLSVSLDFLIEI